MSDKISIEDYNMIVKAESIIVSKNHVAWVEKTSNEDGKTYKSNIFVYSILEGNIKQFTSGDKDSQPKFSPDGRKLAFLSKRSGNSHIYIIDMDGGEAIQLTNGDINVSSVNWSPDAKYLVFTAIPERKFDDDKDLNTIKKDRFNDKQEDPRIITRMVYRSGTTYKSEIDYTQLFTISVENKEILQLSEGEFNFSEGAFLDNSTIISISKQDADIDLSDEADLLEFKVGEKSSGKSLCKINAMYFTGSPIADHNKILFTTMPEKGKAGQNTTWAYYSNEGPVLFTQTLDRSVEQVKVLENEILCLVQDSGKGDVRTYKDNTFSLVLRADCSIDAFAGDSTELYFIGTDPEYPQAIWYFNGEETKLLKDLNPWIRNKQICIPEEFWLENKEGIKFQGWFFDASREGVDNPPLVLSIHGGPHVMWNNSGSMWHEWQVTVASGYSVLALNPIGSGGYGEDFARIITAKWGVDDARDLLQAVDHFLPRIDKNNLFITGGSYAGFQVANIIGRDNRFKAACAQRGVYNLSTFWTTTDIPIWGLWEMESNPWEKLDLFWQLSPISRVKQIETPLLIIHSENDYRVAISQAEELFVSMKYFGKDVEFVRYPRDGHELSRSGEPDHVLDRLERMISFFDKYRD
ncbi:MAG: S9 family peptidase [Candidatus Heimdallarchaeota archaeon]|nr:S9 family peptidase [Candidatus Heimdallarchaeota archaeon]